MNVSSVCTVCVQCAYRDSMNESPFHMFVQVVLVGVS